MVDAKDVLFGCRGFSIVSERDPRQVLPTGMFLLSGKPVYLRGTNVHGLNASPPTSPRSTSHSH